MHDILLRKSRKLHFSLCKTAIIGLLIAEVHHEGSHVAVTIHLIIKLTGESSLLHKIFVEITFWKHLCTSEIQSLMMVVLHTRNM
jgi:hypothetical protein